MQVYISASIEKSPEAWGDNELLEKIDQVVVAMSSSQPIKDEDVLLIAANLVSGQQKRQAGAVDRFNSLLSKLNSSYYAIQTTEAKEENGSSDRS